MRKAIRDALVAPGAVPSVAGRVYEPGQAREDTPRPYLVVEEGAQDAGNAWGTHAEQVTVIVEGPQTGSGGKTALRIVDQVEREVKATLDNRVIVDEDTAERLYLSYSGNAGPDTVPPGNAGEFPAAIRGLVFTAYTLGWQSELTFTPDPIPGLNSIAEGGYSEVQTVRFSGAVSGTFTLTNGTATDPLAWNSTALQVQVALEALPAIGVGNVLVEGNASGPYTLRFRGQRANQDVAQTTIDTTSLNPSVDPVTVVTSEVATTRDGTGVQTDPTTWTPANTSPALYWRASQYSELQRTNWGVWATVLFRGHVIMPDDVQRRAWVRRISEYLTAIGRVRISDGSPLNILQVGADFEADPFREGQLAVTGRYGVLREQLPGLLPLLDKLNNGHARLFGATMKIAFP